jgi:hypothetical protein
LVGILVGLSIALASAWADFEGLSYFATGAGYAPFGGLRCPVLITNLESGVARARFDNPTTEVMEPFYEVDVSGPVTSRRSEGRIVVPARSSRGVAWAIDARDVDLSPFVFVKMDVLPFAGFPTREDTCGILVANLPGMGGEQILSVLLVVSLLGMAGGLVLPTLGLTPQQAARYDAEAGTERRRTAQALALATSAALLAGLEGWWLFAVALSAVSVLLLVIALRYVLMA